ncbi:MAG: response regulator, partial [Polyangiaceae bacterium]
MAIKVLVFESDAAFAGELRTELGKLGCITQIVDDGNVGLQQAVSDRPDLILLSIELPRMNGFSVCNKLKKDASLKDVPLIIMSSESSDETFEQHRKLRTRAEDYVHKPIAFGELLQHIQPFVDLGTSEAGEGAPGGDQIYIDDDVVVDEPYEDDSQHTQVGRMPDFTDAAPPVAPVPKSFAPKKPVDADIDAFADAAFGRITQSKPPAAPATNGAPAASGNQGMETTVATRVSDMPAPPPYVPPQQQQVQAPHDDGEARRAKEHVRELEQQLSAVKSENARLQDGLEKAVQPEEMERLQREVEDLRTRLASSGKGGAVSSREFLDLRENLNKKDKEILSLRETLGKKDKEVVESRERSLEFARSKGDADDRILAVEREMADSRDKIEALTADKEQAKKASEDFRSRMTRAQADLEVRVKEVDELRAKYAEEISANEAGITALHAEHAAALSESLERATSEHESALGAAKTSHADELQQIRSRHQREIDDARAEHATELDQVRTSLNGQLDQVRTSLNGQLEQARSAHARELDEAHASHASALEQAQSSVASELAQARSSHAHQLEEAAAAHANELAQ